MQKEKLHWRKRVLFSVLYMYWRLHFIPQSEKRPWFMIPMSLAIFKIVHPILVSSEIQVIINDFTAVRSVLAPVKCHPTIILNLVVKPRANTTNKFDAFSRGLFSLDNCFLGESVAKPNTCLSCREYDIFFSMLISSNMRKKCFSNSEAFCTMEDKREISCIWIFGEQYIRSTK